MAERSKHPTHNWRIHRFNSCWMQIKDKVDGKKWITKKKIIYETDRVKATDNESQSSRLYRSCIKNEKSKKKEQSERDITDKSKNQIVTEKSIRLLQQNQYSFHVDSKLTKTEMKFWIERFFNVEVKGINSSRVAGRKKKKRNESSSSCTSYKKMIVRLQDNYFIPLFLN